MPQNGVQRRSLVDLVGEFNVALWQARSILDRILRGTQTDMTGVWEERLRDLNDHVWAEAHSLIVPAAAAHFNAWARGMLAAKDDAQDYQWKKHLAADANLFARTFGVAFRTADSDAPCVLFAIGSRDKLGRYVLEDRVSKSRTGSYKSLAELLPIAFVSAPARSESYTPTSPEWCLKAKPVNATADDSNPDR